MKHMIFSFYLFTGIDHEIDCTGIKKKSSGLQSLKNTDLGDISKVLPAPKVQ